MNPQAEALLRKPVLSLFPGIDLLGEAFSAEGFCVLRGPDIRFGQKPIAEWLPRLSGIDVRFGVVIGGPPCQAFSRARRPFTDAKQEADFVAAGRENIARFMQAVDTLRPDYFVIENVAAAPDVHAPDYRVQRIRLDAREFGLPARRRRHFQIGTLLMLQRGVSVARPLARKDWQSAEAPALASEGRKTNPRGWEKFCAKMGLPPTFALEGFSRAGRYSAVGNGVPIPMGRAVARAILEAKSMWQTRLCVCGCGQGISGRQKHFDATCRKRMQMRRDATCVHEPPIEEFPLL